MISVILNISGVWREFRLLKAFDSVDSKSLLFIFFFQWLQLTMYSWVRTTSLLLVIRNHFVCLHSSKIFSNPSLQLPVIQQTPCVCRFILNVHAMQVLWECSLFHNTWLILYYQHRKAQTCTHNAAEDIKQMLLNALDRYVANMIQVYKDDSMLKWCHFGHQEIQVKFVKNLMWKQEAPVLMWQVLVSQRLCVRGVRGEDNLSFAEVGH